MRVTPTLSFEADQFVKKWIANHNRLEKNRNKQIRSYTQAVGEIMHLLAIGFDLWTEERKASK
jgi:hypothetical protein